MKLQIAQSLAVLALFSGLLSQVAMGGGSLGEIGGASYPASRVSLTAQPEFAAVLPMPATQVASTTEEMLRHLEQLTPDEAAASVGKMEATLAAEVMVEMDNEKAAAIMEAVERKKPP